MRERLLCQWAVMFLLGICIVKFKAFYLIPLGIFFQGGLFLYEKNGRRYIHLLFAILFFIIGFIRGEIGEVKDRNVSEFLNECDSCCYTFQGELKNKEVKNDRIRYYVDNIVILNAKENISLGSAILYPVSDDIPIGSKLLIKGKIEKFSNATNEGNFDEKKYYFSEGYYFKSTEPSISVISVPGFTFREYLYDARADMSDVQESYLSGEESGLLSAMTLGNKESLMEEVKGLFQLSGLAHILAISGLHIAVVGRFIYGRLRKCRMSFLAAGVVAVGLVVAYGMLCGSSVSTVRAVGMFAISILGDILGECYDSVTALAFMAVFILMINPSYIENAGFIFSFVAVLGVVAVAEPLGKCYDRFCECRWKKCHRVDRGKHFLPNLKEIIVRSAITGGAVQLATFPVVANFYYVIPTYVVFLNLILLPVLGLLLGCGLIGSIAGLMGIEFVARGLFFVCHLIIYVYEMTADFSIKLPFSRIVVGHKSTGLVIIYYVILFLYVYYHYSLKADSDRELESMRLKPVTTYVVPIIVLLCIIYLPKKSGFEIDMLDVGQGDGIYVSTEDGVKLFIDGGSTSVSNVGKYRIGPFLQYKGVRKIDYWIVSHTDEDHISGLIDLLRDGYDVRMILLSPAMKGSENLDELLMLAKNNGTAVKYVSAGDRLNMPSLKVDFIWPVNRTDFENINDGCLVFLLKYKDFDAIFTGDISAEQEEELVGSGVLKDVELLKVGHHGSKYSSSESFLECIKPEVAIISAGERNRYGHPHEETLKKLEAKKIDVYRTDEMGQITISLNGGEIGIKRVIDDR